MYTVPLVCITCNMHPQRDASQMSAEVCIVHTPNLNFSQVSLLHLIQLPAGSYVWNKTFKTNYSEVPPQSAPTLNNKKDK